MHCEKNLPWENIQLPSSNKINSEINQERKQFKSLNNIKIYISTIFDKNTQLINNSKIHKYIETCYNLKFDETIEYNI